MVLPAQRLLSFKNSHNLLFSFSLGSITGPTKGLVKILSPSYVSYRLRIRSSVALIHPDDSHMDVHYSA